MARPDPLDPDDDADESFSITWRKLDRIVLLAAEVGALSMRDPCFGDAMEWLTTPQSIFYGRIPVEAAQERENLMRCLILHLVAGERDADPSYVDKLCAVSNSTSLSKAHVEAPAGSADGRPG